MNTNMSVKKHTKTELTTLMHVIDTCQLHAYEGN